MIFSPTNSIQFDSTHVILTRFVHAIKMEGVERKWIWKRMLDFYTIKKTYILYYKEENEDEKFFK